MNYPNLRGRRSRAIAYARFLPSLAVSLACLAAAQPALGQGCVAIRQMAPCPLDHGHEAHHEPQWLLNTSYRWFESDRHFRGTHEEPERQARNTEVINDSHALDLTLTYLPDARNSFSLTLPYLYNDRSSLYEHDRVNRYHMRSKGIGDIRFTAARWLYAPSADRRGNALIGIGIKAPTGNHKAKDIAHKPGGPQVQNVDQSIQLGDGGWGLTFQVQSFRALTERLSLYGDGFYLINPRNTNGVLTHRGRANEAIMSVPDQYMARAGFDYRLTADGQLSAQLGGRVEGIPVSDFIGDSDGFRRPGYVVSIEPGLTYRRGEHSFNLSLPIAVQRNRQQSLQDMEHNAHGDAAFADYSIALSYSRKL